MYFDNQHSIGNDACWIEGQNKQSQAINDYHLFNPYKTNLPECNENVNKLKEFMVENKKMYREGYGFTNGCHVDHDSKLRIKPSSITHGKCKNQLNTRLFKAVPDVSNGGFESLLESRLTQGESTSEKKSCEVTQGKGFETMIPMLSCLKKEIQNVEHIIPTKWIRGGEHTRDHVNQKSFLENNGYVFDEKVWKKNTC